MQDIHIIFIDEWPKIAFDRKEDARKIINERRSQTYKSGARYTPTYYIQSIKLFEDGDDIGKVLLCL